MEVIAITDKGLVRQNNEDSYLVDEAHDLLVICDGMGGHNGGEVASSISVSVIKQEFTDREDIAGELQRVVEKANTAVWSQAQKDPSLHGMGTTVTAAVYREGNLFIAHVGDSGLYLIGSGIRKVTRDHTLAEQLLADGVLKPEDMHSNPYNHILTRALGVEEQIVIDHYQEKVQRGDVVLLCSDGLSDLVSETEIYALVQEGEPPLQEAARSLVDRALSYGGSDNITAILSRI
ncbi:MAG TPA: Stp1/IreP family PP2C-type Ser/Thr phosphatase [Syntrophomonadaceae bacterium]|nr:Stp1/IreP family PP2C-type Ser/Thr phosphatase [Syntrophomonadaceae bacterium]